MTLDTFGYKHRNKVFAYELFCIIIISWTTIQGTAMADCISLEKLRLHVTKLADEIGERNVFLPENLRRAADYISHTWNKQGYKVNIQEYEIDGQSWANIDVAKSGKENVSEIIVIGAHYDSVLGSPGANDNATGIAALLELSYCLMKQKTHRTVRFVAFVNEEPPFFKTDRMGSRNYVRSAKARNDDIRAMFSLETIGYYDNAPNSQRYPPLFNLFYPDTGDFIAFVSNFRSYLLLKRAVSAFRTATDFPVESVATFGFIPGVDWSDHGSFWEEGYPAVMVTDTALYRYPYYHSAQDTMEKIDYNALVRVTEGLQAVVTKLANP